MPRKDFEVARKDFEVPVGTFPRFRDDRGATDDAGRVREIGLNYFEHLYRAWSLAFVCIVHGLFPNIWEHKAKDIINGNPQDFKVK